MKIIVSTSDKYTHVLKVFCFLFNHFWDNNQIVDIIGYSKPTFDLPPNFSFHSMGKDRGPAFWSDDLYTYFSYIEDNFFIYTMEDNFLTQKVELASLEKIKKILNPKVGRVDMTDVFTTRSEGVIQPHTLYKEIEGLKIYVRGQHAKWRASFPMSIWNREYLLRILKKPNMTPWQVENFANRITPNDGYDILGTHHKEMIIAHRNEGVSTFSNPHGINNFRLHGIPQSLIKEMEDKNILNNNIKKLI